MELWNALAGVGAAAAVLVAVWSAIVAHRANGRADKANDAAAEANRIARDANDIAIAALPVPRVVLESRRVEGRPNYWEIFNVGDAELHEATITAIEFGDSNDARGTIGSGFNFSPSAGVGFYIERDHPATPVRVHFKGTEFRRGLRINRGAYVDLV